MSRMLRVLLAAGLAIGVSVMAANPAGAVTSVTISTPTAGAVTFTYSGNTGTSETFATFFGPGFGGVCPNSPPIGGWDFALGPNTPQAALSASPATRRAGDQAMGISSAVTIAAGTYEYCTYIYINGQPTASGNGTVQLTATPTPTSSTTTTAAAADPVAPSFTG